VSPSSKSSEEYEEHRTASASNLHHGLTALNQHASVHGLTSKVHLISSHHLASSAILAHHQVHKSTPPKHNEAAEKGEKPDKDDLVKAVTRTPTCIHTPPQTAAGRITPPITTATQPVPEPAGLLVMGLMGAAGLIVRRRSVRRTADD
jgi:hypothetical protein